MCPTLRSPDLRFEKEFLRMYANYSSSGAHEWCAANADALNDFAAYVTRLRDDAAGIGVQQDWVPTSHFWLHYGDDLVGTLRVRHYLTAAVEQKAGHIGYDISPAFRRRGLGYEILRLGLIEATNLGIDDVLAICSESNFASRRILEFNGTTIVKICDGEVRYRIRKTEPSRVEKSQPS